MAICVTTNTASQLIVSSQSIGSCTDYVLVTAQEYAVQTPAITPTDAVFLSWAIVAVWAAAYSIKVLRRGL